MKDKKNNIHNETSANAGPEIRNPHSAFRNQIIDRRDFLKLGGLGIAGTTFIELPFNKLLRIGPAASKWKNYVEKTVSTVCQLCPGACGLRVRLVDGFPVSVSGNKLHPVNLGKLCPKGLSSLQSYYHPARIKGPLVKKNGKFESISWDDALTIVGSNLKKLRAGGSPQYFAFLYEGLNGVSYHLANKFSRVYGTPNFISMDSNMAVKTANYFTLGGYQSNAYDLESTDLILSFGSRMLDSWESPLYGQRMISKMREERKNAKLIHIESRCSTTAARADEWIPVRPGTEGALALGIAYVIIKEKLYDETFVSKHTYGFDNIPGAGGEKTGFQHLVLEKYHPFVVADITGVPSDKIISLAKMFAFTPTAVAMIDTPLTCYTNGVLNAMAVNALNALKGNIDQPGGVLKQRKLSYESFDDYQLDDVARKGLSGKRIDEAWLDDKTGLPVGLYKPSGFKYENYPVSALMLYNTNPAHHSPLPRRFLEWMNRIPFSVSFSSIWNETAAASTLILPEHHFLERWQDVPASEVIPASIVGLSQPVTETPMYDTRNFIDIIAGIAKKAGQPLGGAMDIPPSDRVIKSYFESIYNEKRGMVFADKFPSAQIRILEERGWWSDPHGSFDNFWKSLQKKGGWWDPAYTFGEWGRLLTTPSRKYEFFSQHLDSRLSRISENQIELEPYFSIPRKKMAFPHFEKSVFSSSSSNYPLYLNVYEPISYSGGVGGDIPYLLENPTAPVKTFWETWVEIHPSTAKHLGLSDGDRAFVESPYGKIEMTVRYFPAAQPLVVSIPGGLGRKSFTPDVPCGGSNVMEIVSPHSEILSGGNGFLSTMVKVYKS